MVAVDVEDELLGDGELLQECDVVRFNVKVLVVIILWDGCECGQELFQIVLQSAGVDGRPP